MHCQKPVWQCKYGRPPADHGWVVPKCHAFHNASPVFKFAIWSIKEFLLLTLLISWWQLLIIHYLYIASVLSCLSSGIVREMWGCHLMRKSPWYSSISMSACDKGWLILLIFQIIKNSFHPDVPTTDYIVTHIVYNFLTELFLFAIS